MRVYDYLILLVVFMLVVAAVLFIRKKHRQGMYCTGCSGCCENCRKHINK